MAAIASIGIKYTDLQPNEKGYVNLSVNITDDTNQWGQNVNVTLSQSKDEREAKVAKQYVGNGKVVWMNEAGVKVADKVENNELTSNQQSTAGREESDGLPF